MSERIEGSNPSLPIDKYNRYAIIQVVDKKLLTFFKPFLGDTEMKRLIVTMVVLMGVWSSTALAGPWTNWTFSRSSGYGYVCYDGGRYSGRDGYCDWAFGRSYGYSGGFVYPNTNVDVKYRERWDVQGGERSYEQSPNLQGKVIDAATLIGALLIISH